GEPVPPVAPSATFATVRLSEAPSALAMRTVIVLAVMVAPVMVTTFPLRTAPVGAVVVNAAPSTLYCQELMVVLMAVPVTTDVAGVVAPPAAGTLNTWLVAVRVIDGAGVPGEPGAPSLPVSSAGLDVADEVSP